MNKFSMNAFKTGAAGGIGERQLSTSIPAAEEPLKQSFLYRHRYLWSGLLVLNVALGGYLLLGTKKKTTGVEDKVVEEKIPDVEVKTVVNETKYEALPSASVVTTTQQIPKEEQRQLFKWILDEKRKIKTSDPLEKKRIDEEKALLKQFIRSKEIPTL
jgi:hypothetical protein|uniref:Transmembrane protein n=1 Tax=Picea sitchensis TaxID=3332 RepID=A9NTJ0_PICSI|nr:unknown [Picea sitchensis]